MNKDEPTVQCAIRKMREETGLKECDAQQIGVYSNVDRDTLRRNVIVANLSVTDPPKEVIGKDDAAKAQWLPKSALSELVFAHADIMDDALSLYNSYIK